FARADELDWHAGHRTNRDGRAAARVDVHLGQNQTGDRDVIAKSLRDVQCFLTEHRVNDEQSFHRRDVRHDGLQLTHQFRVQLRPSGGIQNHDAESTLFSFFKSAPGKFGRLEIQIRFDGYIESLTELLQLLYSRGTIRIARDQHDALPFRAKQTRQLARGSRFA